MIDYSLFPNLNGIYLEDSYVLAIHEESGRFIFVLDAVLTPAHPCYDKPGADEQYCTTKGNLIFANVVHTEWIQQSFRTYTDATGEKDFGNVDSLTIDGDVFIVEGDWGVVRIQSDRQPFFEIAS